MFYLNSIGFENKDVVVYGMSLGSHMALYTVVNGQENGDLNALILEVPFTSLQDTVKQHIEFKWIKLLPLDLLVKDKSPCGLMNCSERLKGYKVDYVTTWPYESDSKSPYAGKVLFLQLYKDLLKNIMNFIQVLKII